MRIEKPTPIGDHVITIRELTVADIRALLVESMQQHGDVGLIPEQADLVLNATLLSQAWSAMACITTGRA